MKVLITLLALIIFPTLSIVGQNFDFGPDHHCEFVIELEDIEAEENKEELNGELNSQIVAKSINNQSELARTQFYDQICLEVVTPPPELTV